MILGLCGMSGAGKTTVSDFFKNKGFYIVNCDEVAHNVTDNNKDCLLMLKKVFGDLVLQADGTLNRKTLGEIVFNSKEKLNELNKITHPFILDEIRKLITNKNNALLDAPALFESGANKFCDKTIAIVAEQSECIKRIMKRDNITYELAQSRILSQPSKDFYYSNCDYVIENNDINEVYDKLEKLFTFDN